jgi:simple sugar transport system ATP-binding protein
MAEFLHLSNISKSFGGVRALQDVTFALDVGEVHCLVGENGSGKSTLIKIIAGILEPATGGRIVIDGKEYPGLDPAQSTACGIQVIYQDLSLFPNLTVGENIAIAQNAGAPHFVKRRELRRVARAAMQKIGVSLDLDVKVSELSISARQLVAICRALAANARLVIMDEPTSSLTRHEVDVLLELVRDMQAEGISTLFVSHRLDEVLEVASRVTVLRDGKNLGTFPSSEITDQKLALLMTGKEFRYNLTKPDLSDRQPCLSVSQLCRVGEYDDISFELRPGEILGVTGLLGSGRTELALSLFGMAPADSGEIRIDGERIHLRTNQAAIAAGIGYVPEDRLGLGLILDQSISSNIVVTVLKMLLGPLGLINPRKKQSTADRWIRNLTIKVANPSNAVKTLSGGNQQRVVVGKWLARSPRILILDSPTVGVDISAKDGIYEIVRNLAAQGVAVLMISDEIPEVLYHSHRVLIMRNGRLTGEYVSHLSSEQELMEAVNA